MIVAIGVDATDIDRIRALLRRGGPRLLHRLCTPAEADYCAAQRDPGPSLAARFAAKEAVMKCLGTGWAQGIGFRQIEVVRDHDGAVGIALASVARNRAAALGIGRFHLSLTHTATLAIAFAVAERQPPMP